MVSAIAPQRPPQYAGGVPLLHNFLQFRRAPLTFWTAVGSSEPVVRVRFGPSRELWVVTDADLLQHILQREARNYPRSRHLIRLDPIDSGQTVFNAPTWADWLWRRRLLQPAFHRKLLDRFAEAMVDETQRLMAEWQDGSVISLKAQMKRLTMRIIGRAMFSAPLTQTATLQHCFEMASLYTFRKTSAVVRWPHWLPLPLHVRTRRALQQRYDLIAAIVQRRLQSETPQDDLLDTLIAANLEDGTRFSAENIVHEMISIIFAGHETTAVTLTWIFYLLARHEDVAQRLTAEVDETLGGQLPTVADIDKLTYTRCVIEETMRLFPPVYLTLREARKADGFGNYQVPAGSEIVVNIRGLHRDRRFWSEPERFDPSRFESGRVEPRHKHAYMPFLIGPRKCIGDGFAMLELQLVVAAIVQKMVLQRAGPPLREIAGFVMEPEGTVPMRVVHRRRPHD